MFSNLVHLFRTEFVDLFFLDTSPFVQDYFTNPDNHVYDWRNVSPAKIYTANLLKVSCYKLYTLLIRVQSLLPPTQENKNC